MKGLDIGTNTIICASPKSIELQRDAFLSLEGMQTTKTQLKKLGVSYIELSNKIYIIGTAANELAAIFNNSELKRPLKDGMLNPSEQDALPILAAIIKSLLGDPEEGEHCVYSIPAAPIDINHEIDYHDDMLKLILQQLGYTPISLNEAVAISNVGLINDNFTGITISMGAGMTNIAIMYKGISVLTFSVSKGGDWIDKMVAQETGLTIARIRMIKEKNNYSISNGDRSREQQAIKTYYEAYIRYILKYIEIQFTKNLSMPNFENSVPIVIGGGGCMVNGFIDSFKQQFVQKEFPLEISDIKLVEEPLTAVARGCLEEAKIG